MHRPYVGFVDCSGVTSSITRPLYICISDTSYIMINDCNVWRILDLVLLGNPGVSFALSGAICAVLGTGVSFPQPAKVQSNVALE